MRKRFYYDTEFLEDGKTIELLSIGIISEDDREYYAVVKDAPWDRVMAHNWLSGNVLPYLPRNENKTRKLRKEIWRPDPSHPDVKPYEQIALEVRRFLTYTYNPETYEIEGLVSPELWAYFAAYDHVALMQLWGPMIGRPPRIPMYTHDLKQEMHNMGISKDELPTQELKEHHALEDARWNRDAHLHLLSLKEDSAR